MANKTLIATITGDTFVTGGTFDDARQAAINGIVSAQSEAHGFNAERSNIPVTALVRTSDTVITLTIPSLATYDITAQEVLTWTIPASILTGGVAIVATPTWTIDPVEGGSTYNEALTLALSAGLARGGPLSAGNALTLALSADLVRGVTLSAVDALILSLTADFSRSSILSAINALTLAIAAGKVSAVTFSGGVTYYVDQTGGLDSNSGRSADNAWKTIAKVNGETFSAGDSILFKKGCTWREQLTVPSSGSAGNPVTFGAYGSGADPIISGYLSKSNTEDWTDDTGNIWYATSTKDIGHIKSGTTVLPDKKGSKVLCTTQGQFFWEDATDRLYIYSTSNPATYYSGDVELAQKPTGGQIYINAKNYITIEDIAVIGSGTHGLQAVSNSGLILQRLVISYIGGAYLTGTTRYGNGVEFWDSLSDLVLQDSTISQCFDEGFTSQGQNSTTRLNHQFLRNTVDKCGRGMAFSINAGSPTITNPIIEGNTFTDSGLGWATPAAGSNGQGIGAMLNSPSTTGGIFRNNIIRNTASGDDPIGQGITLIGGAWTITRNIIDNTHNGAFRPYADPSVIFAYNLITRSNGKAHVYSTGDDSNSNYTYLYNNVFYESDNANIVMVQLGENSPYGVTKHVFKNNLVVMAGTSAWPLFKVPSGSEVVADYNMYYRGNSGQLITWLGSTYTQAQWADYLSASSQDEHSPAPQDPLFVSTVTPDFSLQAASPAINAGVDVGLTSDYLGNAIVGLPDIGAYEYIGGTTYNEALTLALAAGLARGGPLSANNALALALSADLTRGGVLSAVNAMALAIAAGLDRTGLANMTDAVTLVLSAAQDQFGSMSFDEAVTLAMQAAEARTVLATMNNAMSFGISADESPSGQTEMIGALSLGISADMPRASVLEIVAAYTLGIAIAEAHTSGLSIQEALTFAVNAAKAQSANAIMDAGLSLDVAADKGAVNALSANDAASLSVSVDEAATASTWMSAGILLGVESDFLRSSVIAAVESFTLGIAAGKDQSAGVDLAGVVTLAVLAAKAQSSVGNLLNDVSLGVSAGKGLATALSAVEGKTFSVSAGAALSAVLSAVEAFALGIAVEKAVSGGADFSEAVILAVNAISAQAASAEVNAALSFGVDAEESRAGSLSAQDSISFAIRADKLRQAIASMSDVLSLGIAASKTQSGGMSAQEALTLAMKAAKLRQAASSMNNALSLGVTADETSGGPLTANEAASLGATVGDASSTRLEANAGLSLSVSADQGSGGPATFNSLAELIASAGMSLSPSAVMDAVVGLSLALGLLQESGLIVGEQTYEVEATLAASAGMTPSVYHALQVVRVLAVSAGMSQAAVANLQEAVTLATAAGQGQSGQSVMVNALALQATASMIQSSVGSLSASLNLDVSMSEAFGTALILQASVLLGTTGGLSASGGMSFDEAAALRMNTGMAQVMGLLLSEAVTLNAQASQAQATTMTAEAQAALAIACDQIDVAFLDSTSYVSLSLSIVAGMQQWGIVPRIAAARHLYNALARKREYDATARTREYNATPRKREYDDE